MVNDPGPEFGAFVLKGRPTSGRGAARVAGLMLPLALCLWACDRHVTSPILDLDCSKLKLRFEERGRLTFETSYWSEVLLIDKGSGWVDLSEMGVSADSYPTLLAKREFPFDDERPGANPLDRSYSSIIVSQKSASRADFDAISGCLAKNIVAIDHAFLAARPELDAAHVYEFQAARRPQLIAIFYYGPPVGVH